MKIPPNYKTRFVSASDASELINLYHLARVALDGKGKSVSKYERKIWASKEFSKKFPSVSVTAAYKDLDGLLS